MHFDELGAAYIVLHIGRSAALSTSLLLKLGLLTQKDPQIMKGWVI